jgi:hypothetical protein
VTEENWQAEAVREIEVELETEVVVSVKAVVEADRAI